MTRDPTGKAANRTASGTAGADVWPALPYEAWQDTCATLHLWTQIVGKIRLALTPWTNHSWHVTLYLTGRGLTTSPMPCGSRVLEIEFDFLDHLLRIQTADGKRRELALAPRSVADFHDELFARLAELGLEVHIHPTPNELEDPIPFHLDRDHDAYDAGYATRFWRVLAQTDRVFKEFRARFIGKCSPVQFFWGSFDLAVTRFSGRRAPEHPGGIPNLPDWVTREAYSHEVSSVGFWPGGAAFPQPIFYAYAYPTPAGFAEAAVRPEGAFWSEEMGEFMLPYDAMRGATSPDDALLAFLQSTYEASAELATWDRAALEWANGPPR